MAKFAGSRQIVSVVFLFVLAAYAMQARAATVRNMDGTWEGALTVAYPAATKGETEHPFTLRVEINGDKARVFLKQDTGWIEAKAGLFHVQRLRSNAVVTAIDSASDNEGVWVETWSIAITQKSDDTALAIYSRLVNNEDLPATSDHKAFSVAGAGELKRSN